MKRMVAMLTVVALMVVMLAMSVTPAFAVRGTNFVCTGGPFSDVYLSGGKYKNYYEDLGYECVHIPKV
jgi:hypothetical protein